MEQLLILFGKVPRAGEVKTRLTPVLSPVEAARLYLAFLRDTIRRVRRLGVDVRLSLAPPIPEEGLKGLPPEIGIRAQEGEGLGERLETAFRGALDAGYDRVVVMGTDHPTLPASFIEQAFRVLDAEQSLCIGPTQDGGFYLMGMRAVFPELFEEMSYSHSSVFADTLARVERTEARLTVLPQWYDVDTPEDLDRLYSDLQASGADAPHTHRLLDELGLDFSS